MKRSRLSLVVGGFAAGMVVGAALAVCLAPDRGEATRQRLAAKGVNMGQRGTEAMRTALEDSRKAVAAGQDRWRPAVEATSVWLRSRVASRSVLPSPGSSGSKKDAAT